MKYTQLLLAATIYLANSAIAADFKLDASGSEPLYQSTLPKEVYQQSRVNDLQDLTISNAAGEQVPYALLPYDALHAQTATTQDTKSLSFFPLKESNLSNLGELTVQIEKIANEASSMKITTKSFDIAPNDTSIGGKTIYLVDVGKKHPPLQTLSLDWQGSTNVLITVDVLASDDLKNWSNAGHGVLLKTSADGKALRQDKIHLDRATEARYLQLRYSDNSTFSVTKINAEYNSVRSLSPAILWQNMLFLNREQDDKKGVINLDFESLGRYPATHLQVKLPQTNTITNASIFVRNKNDAPWQYLTTISLYRMDKSGKSYTNLDILLNKTASRFWRLQFNQANGGIGQENPSLMLGWLPQTVVWNARGQAPFTLKIGENPAIVNTVPVTSLVADYKAEKVLQLPNATLSITESKINNVNQTAMQTNAWTSAPDYKSWLLWAGLFLGVLLLAGMAYSLIKTERKE